MTMPPQRIDVHHHIIPAPYAAALGDAGYSMVAGVAFTVGAVLALRHSYEAHRWVQTATVIVSTILVFWMVGVPPPSAQPWASRW